MKSKLLSHIEPFHLLNEKVKVRAGATVKLMLSFLPFEIGNFASLIGFYDSKVGEFYYEVHGKSAQPAPLEKYSLQIKVEEEGSKELIIPHRNVQAEKAKLWIETKI